MSTSPAATATLTTRIAGLVRDAGTAPDIEDRARLLRAEITNSGLATAESTLDLALCFHYAVIADDEQTTAAIERLRGLTRSGDYAYYVDIAHFMSGLPNPAPLASGARWLDGEPTVRHRWRDLVERRRALQP